MMVPYFRLLLVLSIMSLLNEFNLAAVENTTGVIAEVEALLAFKSLIVQDDNHALKSWNELNKSHMCEWTGITCDEGGHVKKLELLRLGLAGRLAPQLGNLSFLSTLNLTSNSFKGAIPSELSYCTFLEAIDLSFNHLTSTISTSLASLSRLQFLRLSYNNLSGEIPIGIIHNCTSLEFLQLASNRLHGSIPELCATLPRIQYLYLKENYLSGHIPLSLANCTSLTKLSLQTNNLTGPIPSNLGSLTKIQLLFLFENDLTGPIPSSIANCSNLQKLELYSNSLSGSIPTEMGMLHNILYIVFFHNNLSGRIPPSLANLSTSLYQLDLGFNQLSGPIPAQLAQLKRLQRLDLGSNRISDVIPPALSNCSSLYHLDLSFNRLKGEIPSSFGEIKALQMLYLQGNHFIGSIPDSVGSNLQFQDLNLSHNQLTGSVPTGLAFALSSLQFSLDISYNEFSGSVPSWLGELVEVETISLSHNNFSGSIPESIGQCEGLLYLSLSHNHLTGELPQHLQNLSYLVLLDVSRNQLTGPLPSFLGSLKFLQFLDVSFNNFSGSIPTLGVFKHLDAHNFLGNPGLCGQILHTNCTRQHHHHQLSKKAALLMASCLPLVLVILMLLFGGCFYQRFSRRKFKIGIDPAMHMKYKAAEIEKATQGYSHENLLGEGGLSSVYKATLPNDRVVAVKKLKDVAACQALLQEMHLLGKLRHKNIVRVLGCVLNLEVKALVLEYMQNGTLDQYLHNPISLPLDWKIIMRTAIAVANGLEYLHHDYGVPIIHGDVKPSNILFDAEFEAHIADFGIAKLSTNVNRGEFTVSSNFKGSFGYMAPEFTYSTRISTKVDVYSYGIVILEMLTRRKPTHADGVSLNHWAQSKLYTHGSGVAGVQQLLDESLLCEAAGMDSSIKPNNVNTSTAMQLLELAFSCTRDQPNHRPTMREVSKKLEEIEW